MSFDVIILNFAEKNLSNSFSKQNVRTLSARQPPSSSSLKGNISTRLMLPPVQKPTHRYKNQYHHLFRHHLDHIYHRHHHQQTPTGAHVAQPSYLNHLVAMIISIIIFFTNYLLDHLVYHCHHQHQQAPTGGPETKTHSSCQFGPIQTNIISHHHHHHNHRHDRQQDHNHQLILCSRSPSVGQVPESLKGAFD